MDEKRPNPHRSSDPSDPAADRGGPDDAPPTRTTGVGPVPQPTAVARSIGQYRIVGKLGAGGMGVVYEAEQQHPKRRVALKVVRGGQFVDDGRVRMFQREADTLARLKHPNIGAIYESGRTEDGQHFFAMELVRGETLDAYIARQPRAATRRDVRPRLVLFRKIADAVHYAHQRGVIHRDLKPSNIVVTDPQEARGEAQSAGGVPEVKILDFGLARITEGDLAAATLATEVGVIKGTLAYMSPEQARGNPDEIDVRTDVYALGVILYELLTGQRPYDVMSKSLVEAVRVICEETPKPLRSRSGLRKLDPDIETIVRTALAKEADRRYASAAMLSGDVERYLTAQPILARPPSTLYQVRKFAQRNRALVAGLAGVLLALSAGVVASTLQARKATREADKAAAVSSFLHEMFAAASPMSMTREDPLKGRDVTVLQILGDASRRLEGGALADQPLVEAAIRETIGSTYRDLGEYPTAETNLQRSLEIRERELGASHADVAASLEALGLLRHTQGELDEAESLLRRALEIRERRLGEGHVASATTARRMADVLQDLGRVDEAEALYGAALAVQRGRADEPETARTLSSLAMLRQERGDLPAAERMLREALDIRRARLGDEHPDVARTLHDLAFVLKARGDLAGSEGVMREAVRIWKKLLGDDHPFLSSTLVNLGVVLQAQGKLAETEPLLHEALRIMRRSLGDEHPSVGATLYNLAKLEQAQGKLVEAEGHARQALGILAPLLPADHPTLAAIRSGLGSVLTDLGRAKEAEPLLREALGVYEATAPDKWYCAQARSLLGAALLGQGRYADAEPLLLQGYEGLRDDPGVSADRRQGAVERIVRLYESWGRGRADAAQAALWRERLAAQVAPGSTE